MMMAPTTYERAMNSDEAQNWQEAMDDQMRALQANDTFVVTDPPGGKQVVGERWVYSDKEDPERPILRPFVMVNDGEKTRQESTSELQRHGGAKDGKLDPNYELDETFDTVSELTLASIGDPMTKMCHGGNDRLSNEYIDKLKEAFIVHEKDSDGEINSKDFGIVLRKWFFKCFRVTVHDDELG